MIAKIEFGFHVLLDALQDHPIRRTVFLVVMSLALLLPGLSAIPVLDRDEARFMQASKQMIETGDYIDIRLQQVPRWKKPVGIYWLQAGAVHLSGQGAQAAHWVYRLPSLAAGIASVLLCYWAFHSLIGRRAATLAAMMLGSSFLWMAEAHIAKTDMVLLVCVLLAHGALVHIYIAASGARARFSALHWLFWVALGLGILVKGPIILIVSAGIVLWCSLASRNLEPLMQLRPAPGVLVTLVVAAPWFVVISIKSGGAFWDESLFGDLLGKVAGVQEKHAGPPGYYLATLWITFFPWMPLFILAIASLWADRRAQRMRILLGWSLPFWLLYALFPTKLPHYLLPTFPAFCAMLAYWLVSRNEQSQGALLRWAAAAMFALTGLILASVNIVVVPLLERQFPLWGIVAGIAAIPVVLVGARALAQGRLGGFAGLAMLSALLIYPALMQITLPSLQSFLLTPRLVALWNNFNGCTDAPLVATGYHEPSLVFETATDTKLVGLAQAVKLLNGPSAYLVALEARGEETLDQKLAGQDLSVRILGQVTGTNYNRGGISMIYLLANPDDRAFNACLDERPKALQ